jgi:hypothetical protein
MLDLGQFTQRVQMDSPWTAAALRMIENAINHLAKNTGASPVGNTAAPDPIQALNVKVSGEMAHITVTDDAPVQKTVHYFAEVANEPNFLQPHVVHMGTSRGAIIPLPTNDDTGAPQNWYFRGYSQYPGSKPNQKVNFGTQAAPQAVPMGGGVNGAPATNMTLLPSTGSGTASGNGQQGGQGFGNFLHRPPVGPKRAVMGGK